MNKIYEGFEDAFDSSLIDYSHDFEANDKNHLKKQIEIWVELFLAPDRTTQWSKRNGILPYTINEDCTITLNTSFILFETAYSCLDYKLSKSRIWLETLSPDDRYEYPILWEFFLPIIKKEFTDIDITGSKQLTYLEKSVVSTFIMNEARYISYDQINLYSGHNFSRENNWLYKIPDYINIASCYGDFTVRAGSRIKSMRGFPREIGGGFTISNLKSLAISNGGEGFKDGPIKVNGKIEAWHCDFTNEDLLAGFPKYCGFEINLTNNNLTSLDGLPETIESDLVVDGNNLANLKGTVKCVKGSIDATLQQPDYKELTKFYREKYKIEDNVNITEDMLSRIMGPRGIKFFGVELRFGYNPITDGYWKFEADYKNSENNMPIPKLVEGPENSAMLQGIRWWDPISKSGKEMRWIKEEKVNEGFENAFDSSLIDYSDDFKKQDTKQAIINDIEKWIDFFVKTNSSDNSVEYRINDDLSIDLLNNKSGTLNKNFEFFCIKPFKQFQLHTLKNSKTIIYTDLTDNFGNPLPIDRLPDFINFRNVAGGFSCQGCDFTTLKGCPSGIVEGVYDCTHNNLENFDYLPKHCVSIDAGWQRGKKLYDDKYIDFSSLVKSLNDRSIDPGDLIENWDETYLELWIPKTPKSMDGYETYLSPYITWENKNSKRPRAICSLGTKTGEGTLGEWKYKDIKEIIQKHYPEKYEEFINKIK